MLASFLSAHGSRSVYRIKHGKNKPNVAEKASAHGDFVVDLRSSKNPRGSTTARKVKKK